jgi:putative iron-regulated protein
MTKLTLNLFLYLLLAFAPLAFATVSSEFETPRRYRQPFAVIDFDAQPQASALIERSRADYQAALDSAVAMADEIERFLVAPTEESMTAARKAWRAAREHYQRTEWMRFVDGPIDWPHSAHRLAGPEGRLNAWPVNEAVMDYVEGDPDAGMISDLALPLSTEMILSRNQVGDENDVTTGWHAIEFLLWGQDHSKAGPGDRSYRDYLPGDPVTERRASYLRLLTELLVRDLRYVSEQWEQGRPGNHASRLAELPSIEVLGAALHGAASLIAIELQGERLSVALDSGMQEDEHSCFSDNTLADLRANLAGIIRMLGGTEGTAPAGSLRALIASKSPALAKQLLAAMNDAELKLAQIPEPFDQLILSGPRDKIRAKAEAAIVALQNLALQIKASAEALSVQIAVPGV